MRVFERNAILGFFAMASLLPLIVRNEYILHLGIMVLFSVVLASSFNLIVGYVGEFPLGHMAFLGIGAYAAAIGSSKLGLPVLATVPFAAICAAIAGLVIGLITLRLRGPFFVIITLSFAEVLRLVASNWIGLTNGPMGISGIGKPTWLVSADALGQKTGFYYIALGLTAITLYIAYRFVYSNLGRAAVAVRENRFVSQSVGISPFHYALLTFVLAASLAGLGGGFYAHYISFVGPEMFGFALMASTIIMVLLGGKGTLVGPILGAALVVVLEEYLRDFKELRMSIFGAIVVAVVLFMPRGIMGFLHARREKHIGGDAAPVDAKATAVRPETLDARSI